jgi:hypothetical protein
MNGIHVFDAASFAHPDNKYRPLQIVHGMDHMLLDAEHLVGEAGIDQRLNKLKEMGLGGIVTNVGFRDYMLSPRQWEIYRYGLRKAAELGMALWLYDEKGYPSGSAGGIVTRSHPEYVNAGLACYRQEIEGPAEVCYPLPLSCRRFVWAGALPDPTTATRASVWDLTPPADAQGTLSWRVPAGRWTLLYMADRVMYEGTHASGNVCDFKQYINLLMPEAVAEFLRVTHDQYVRETPPDLWAKIQAIFTDEPSLMTTYTPELPERFHGKIPVVDALLFTDRPPAVPWVHNFPEQFQALKGYDLRPYLYALFTSESEEARYVRQDFYEVVTRLYTASFYTQVLRWCQAHGVASSGHVLAEENLLSHVAYHGSLFSAIREMDLPGVDMLNSDPQDMLAGDSFMTIKQVASAAHLSSRTEIHSESSDWVQHNQGRFATLAERRGQGNLQYVLGVNQITAYWGWDEIGAEAYRQYNDYMGRLASLLTGGSHVCDVAVLYPVRSAWADFVPVGQPLREEVVSPALREINAAYPALVRTLLRSQIDLDIIDEEAIVSGHIDNGVLRVADEGYRAIVLPPLHALGLDTANALAAFARSGGLLVSSGALPELAESASRSAALRRTMSALFGAQGAAHQVEANAVASFLRAHLGAGPDLVLDTPDPNILYTHRRLEDRDLCFIINNAPTPVTLRPALRVPGPYTLYRPLTGSTESAGMPLVLTLAEYEGVFVVADR